MRSTISTKSVRRNCSGETLTATVSARPGFAVEAGAAQHPFAQRGDKAGILRTGMNSTGRMSPRSGCFQRASASTPTIFSPLLLTIGW